MFEFLIVLAIATICVLGWIGGNLFVCVFLSLPVGAFILLAATANGPAAGGFALVGVFLLAGIWLPFIIRRC